MVVEELELSQIKPYKKNPRRPKRSEQESTERLAAAIQKYGFRVPILVDETNTVLAGHSRLRAARHLKLKTVPVHVVRGLSEAEKIAFRISENRVHEHTTWETDLLHGEILALQELDFGIELTGFTSDELQALLDGDQREPETEDPNMNQESKGHSICFPDDAWQAMAEKIVLFREQEQDQSIPDWRCIELMVASF